MDSQNISNRIIALLNCSEPYLGIIFLCLAYIILLLVVRRIWIYSRNRMHLRAYADMIEAECGIEQEQSPGVKSNEYASVDKILGLLQKARVLVPEKLAWYCLLGGTGKQLAAWRLAHEADRVSTELWPTQKIEANAVIVKEQLKKLGSDAANALSAKILKIMEGSDKTVLKSLVKEARGMLFEARDCYFEDLADWQNKAMWLVIVALIILFLVAALIGNERLLLLGAVGGLLARLRKALTSKSVGFDYGVSWSILFLAPIVGALTGWVGVLIATKFIDPNVLSMTKEGMQWDQIELSPIGMLLAVIFGYSATLFDRVMEGAETAITKKPPGSAAGTKN